MSSNAELLLAVQLEQAGVAFYREFVFAAPRKFRADFLVIGFDTSNLLIEVEGGTWVQGRHVRGAGVEADCEKSALAAIRGYRFMRVTSAQVEDGRAFRWIRQALGMEARAA